MTMPDRNLFSSDKHDMNEAYPPSDGMRLFYVTNRYNLNEILSSGLVAPLAAFDKYYDDLLSIAPGRIPLFGGTVDHSIIEAVSEKNSGDAYPVIIEFDRSTLSGTEVQTLQPNGVEATSSLSGGQFGACAPAAIIPRTALRMVHFLGERQMKDYASHPLSNVRSNPPAFSVSPDIVSKGPISFEQLEEWMRDLPPTDGPDQHDISIEDRIGGAVIVANRFATPRSAIMRGLLHFAEGGIRNEKDLAPLAEMPHWLRQPIRPRRWADTADLPDDQESVLFRSAVSVLSRVDIGKTSDRIGILGDIRDEFRSTGCTSTMITDTDEQLERLEDILLAKERFEGFKDKGSNVIKALLLVLLPFKLDRFLSMKEDKFRTDDDSIPLTAGIFFGLIKGRKTLPLSLRDAELDDRLTIAAASTLAADFQMIGPHVNHRVGVSAQEIIEGWLKTADFSSDPARDIGLEIIQDHGLQGCFETIVIPPGDSPMEMFYTKSRRDGRRKVVAFRMDGEAEVVTEIKGNVFVDRFLSGNYSVSEELLARIKQQVG